MKYLKFRFVDQILPNVRCVKFTALITSEDISRSSEEVESMKLEALVKWLEGLHNKVHVDLVMVGGLD
jgi:hypothetical protein